MPLRISPQELDAHEGAFSDLLATIDREGVRIIVAGRIARTVQQEVALLALAARGAQVVSANGRNLLARAVSPEAALAYGGFERMRELRQWCQGLKAKESRRKELQSTWREMSAAVRACPPGARARCIQELAATV
jgi:hypothetical protein